MAEITIGLTGIVPFTYFGGLQRTVGSTHLRVDELIAENPDFRKWQHGRKYDNLIFQKAYWLEMMEQFSGPKILDICDPDWIHDNIDIVEISQLVHAVTCSSPSLTAYVKTILPGKRVYCVPDRLNFNSYPEPRGTHTGFAKEVVWFGFIHNAVETLPQLLPKILELNLKLIIVAERSHQNDEAFKDLEAEYIKYDKATIYEIIKKADIVLNPRSKRAFWKYKSNNKSIISWKLGVPVAESTYDLVRLMEPDSRNSEVIEMSAIVAKEYDICQSADQYRNIIKEIKQDVNQ